jgi:hypothetical protein
MLASRRSVLVGLSGLPLAACGGSNLQIDPKTINFVELASEAANTFCRLLPTADTLAKIALAMALPVATPVEQVAAAAAHAFCDQAGPVIAKRKGRRGIEPGTGKPTIDYGPVIINGKPVNIAVYA